MIQTVLPAAKHIVSFLPCCEKHISIFFILVSIGKILLSFFDYDLLLLRKNFSMAFLEASIKEKHSSKV
jgi:hypothetical protein